MMSDDISNLRDTTEPKSDQLNYDDFSGADKVITVTKVSRGATKEQPINIDYLGGESRPYKPCKSMRRVLLACWGEDGKEWVGKKIKLYGDPSVKFGGVAVGGIRIRALSGIEEDKKLLLSTSKGKRAEFLVKKLETTYPQASFDSNANNWVSSILAGKLSIEALKKKASDAGTEFTAQQIKELETRLGDK